MSSQTQKKSINKVCKKCEKERTENQTHLMKRLVKNEEKEGKRKKE